MDLTVAEFAEPPYFQGLGIVEMVGFKGNLSVADLAAIGFQEQALVGSMPGFATCFVDLPMVIQGFVSHR